MLTETTKSECLDEMRYVWIISNGRKQPLRSAL